MITIQRQYRINGGTAPYTYNWTAVDGCVTFSPATGTTNSLVDVEFRFQYESCFDTAGIRLAWTDVNGCSGFAEIAVDNPCDEFTISAIGKSGEYTFTVSAVAPSCSNISYEWRYSSTLWSAAEQIDAAFNSRITLSPNTTVSLPDSTPVQVIVTDCHGCQKSAVINHEFCVPDMHDFALNLYCAGTQYLSDWYTIPDPVNCPVPVDWSTLVVEALLRVPGVTFETNGNQVRFRATLTVPVGQYQAQYTALSQDGIRTTTGLITLSIIACEFTDTINLQNGVYILPCDLVAGDTFEIPLEPLVFVVPPNQIAWNTLQLTTPPVPISPSITFGFNNQGQRVIQYEVPNPPIADSFSFTVCDTAGNCATSSFITVVTCPTTPIANTDTACVGCNQSVLIDVLDNDLGGGGPIVLGSVTLTQAPANGTAVWNGTQFVYTANTGYNGSDVFKYQFQNVLGVSSNEGTVNVTVLCAGGTATIIECGA